MPFATLTSNSFEALFNYANIGILVINSGGDIQMANKFIELQFGYPQRDVQGHNVAMLIPTPPGGKSNVGAPEWYSVAGSLPGHGIELAALSKDGREFPVEISLGQYAAGDHTYTVAFVSDITNRKETDRAIVRLNAHLEEKVKEGTQSLARTVEQLSAQIKETERKDNELERVNNFLNNIWNHAGAIIIVCDRNGLIQFFNPAAEKLLGYTADEVVYNSTLAIFHHPAELQQKAAELSLELGRTIDPGFEVLSALSALHRSSDMEWHYVRKDGSRFYVSLGLTPLRDTRNDISSYLGIAIDISEKKMAEAELRTALEKEKELNELKSRFVSMASHEFRTPLSAVLSSAYLLSRYTGPAEQPQRDKHIQRIMSSVASLTAILNDFLSVGKIEEGNIYPRNAPYEITKNMAEAIQEVQHLLRKGQTIHHVHTGSESLHTDPAMMKHIVGNLLSNAIKFSPENAAITLTTQNTDGTFCLTVADKGIGIPVEDQEQLFKRFFRSSNATNIQGTGLGLHIVKKYAELLNGTVVCQSRPGAGTTFTITFKNRSHEDNSDH